MTIRRTPDDFVVEERASAAWLATLTASAAPGTHAVYRLEKVSLTTPEACAALARALGLGGDALDYAGLKDKHARTVQHVSADLRLFRPGSKPMARAGGRGWSARLEGFAPVAISAGSIDGNRFRIVVRGLSAEQSAEMDRRAGLLRVGAEPERGASLLTLNYFGDQRFGSARHGEGFVAKALLGGDFEGALRLAIGTPSRKDTGATREFTRGLAEHWGRWRELSRTLPRCPERRAVEALAAGAGFREAFAALPYFQQAMCVEAFQSHLWNDAARRIASRLAGEVGDMLRTRGLFGEMLFPPAALVVEPWRSASMPAPAPGTVMQEPWGWALGEALGAEGLTAKELRIPGMKRPFFGEAMRPLFVEACGFTMSVSEADKTERGSGKVQRTLEFDLPRGAYATVTLRALGQ